MQLVYERCAGLDVHKKSVVACLLVPDMHGQRQKERQTFSTMTADLLCLRDWLTAQGCTHVEMRINWSRLEAHLSGAGGASGGSGGQGPTPQGGERRARPT